jgi:hypothetical protein
MYARPSGLTAMHFEKIHPFQDYRPYYGGYGYCQIFLVDGVAFTRLAMVPNFAAAPNWCARL